MIADKNPQEFSMEQLLAAEESGFAQPHRGDVVEGTVIGVTADSILVDVGGKAEGVVPNAEMHSLPPDQRRAITVGQPILVVVLQMESDDHPLLLSVDRARGEQGWRTLQSRYESGEIFEASASGFNKGGLLVNVEGVNAFVPLSQVVGVNPDRADEVGGLSEYVGRTLRLKVIEMNRRRNRVILSERAALQEWRAEQKDRLLAELREGEIRKGTITSIRNFGIFVDLGGADGLVHLSELSWERDVMPEHLFKVGDVVDVFIMKVDQESKKIGLSIRRARPEQWDGAVAEYQVGQVVPGVITKLVTFGAFARIEGPVEGLIHVSELVDRRISHPKEVIAEGDIVPVKIVRIERDRHRLGLSLRQARPEAERDGWIFNEAGGIHVLPPAVAAQFGVAPESTNPASVPVLPAAPPPPAAAEERPEPTTAFGAALQRAGLSEQDLHPDAQGN